MLKEKRFCIIGVGKLGGAVAKGLLGAVQADHLRGAVARSDSAEAASHDLGIPVGTNNAAAAQDADVIIVAVKPQRMEEALSSLDGLDLSGRLVISTAAGIGTDRIESILGNKVAVVRAMPNTPCLLGEGMTALAGGRHASADDVSLATAIFDAVGRTVVVDEALMDGVTALSASGPAYVFVIIEALAEAGVKLGISREVSTLLAAQTLRGAAEMVLQLGHHPALLKDEVTTPAGCTIDGLMELEEGKLRVTLIKAVVKASQRAGELV